MTHRSKHLPYYIILVGFILFSVGLNLIQHKEISILKQEKALYKVFFEYLYLKLEAMENKQKDFVYK